MPDGPPAGPLPEGLLPDDFAAQLGRLLAPGEADAAGEVIAEAARLDDLALEGFLDLFAARVRRSTTPIAAAELRELLLAVHSVAPDAG